MSVTFGNVGNFVFWVPVTPKIQRWMDADGDLTPNWFKLEKILKEAFNIVEMEYDYENINLVYEGKDLTLKQKKILAKKIDECFNNFIGKA